MGCPALPFIDQGEAGITDGGKRKNQRTRRSFKGAGSSFSLEPALLTWQTVPGIACLLILIGPCSGFGQLVVASHPTPVDDAVRRVPSCDPTGSGWGNDHTFVIVDDASSLLDCSGCRMLMLGSMSEG